MESLRADLLELVDFEVGVDAFVDMVAELVVPVNEDAGARLSHRQVISSKSSHLISAAIATHSVVYDGPVVKLFVTLLEPLQNSLSHIDIVRVRLVKIT